MQAIKPLILQLHLTEIKWITVGITLFIEEPPLHFKCKQLSDYRLAIHASEQLSQCLLDDYI
jgi:hypothetical protein